MGRSTIFLIFLSLTACGGAVPSTSDTYAVTETAIVTSAPVTLTATCRPSDHAVAWQCATTPHGFYSITMQPAAATADDSVTCAFAPTAAGERVGAWAGVTCEDQ